MVLMIHICFMRYGLQFLFFDVIRFDLERDYCCMITQKNELVLIYSNPATMSSKKII